MLRMVNQMNDELTTNYIAYSSLSSYTLYSEKVLCLRSIAIRNEPEL